MPRYFFNVRDGEMVRDMIGMELPSLDDVRGECELVCKLVDVFFQGQRFAVVVTDEANNEILVREFNN